MLYLYEVCTDPFFMDTSCRLQQQDIWEFLKNNLRILCNIFVTFVLLFSRSSINVMLCYELNAWTTYRVKKPSSADCRTKRIYWFEYRWRQLACLILTQGSVRTKKCYKILYIKMIKCVIMYDSCFKLLQSFFLECKNLKLSWLNMKLNKTVTVETMRTFFCH